MLTARLRDLLCAARDEARARGMHAEFLLHRERSGLIRLGNSAVALATSEELTRLDVSVMEGRRTGDFGLTADITSLDQLRDALARAQESCAASPEKDYQPIFGTVDEAIDDEHGYDPALADLSAEAKTALCAEVIEAVAPKGNLNFSGSWSTGETEIYYTSTANDREDYRRLTDGKLVLVAKENEKKWELTSEQTGSRAADFTAGASISEFLDLLPIYQSAPGYRAPLGPNRVIFGSIAVAELACLAAILACYGRWREEGRAFTAGKALGERIFSPQITIHDNPDNAQVFGMPFDLRGRRRRDFTLVEAGLFQGVMYDSTTAARYHKAPTGHDLENWDLVCAPGTDPAGLAAGLALAGDALYIPFLHYVNWPDPSRGQFTGSSRFNAQRVQGGACTAPLFSTRVTDAIQNVLSNVRAVSSRTVSVNLSQTYERRAPTALSVPEYIVCDEVRINDVAESF